MKKLLTLAISFILANTALNAQNCDFTYQQDPSSGTYYFAAPFFSDTINTQYSWAFENGNTGAWGPYATHSYSQSMIDVVTLTVFGIDSTVICSSSQTIQVVVDTIPGSTCPISYFADSSNSNTYTFYVPGSNYPSNWNFFDGTITNGFEVQHTFPGPGTYQVCMDINSSFFNCSDCVYVTVYQDTIINPSGCDASFYASTSALVGYYIPTGYSNSANASYLWNFGDGSTSSEIYPYHEYAQSGLYEVCLAVTDGPACFITSCKNVFIPASNPVPQDSCFTGFIISQENPFEVNIVNITTANDVNFTWTLTSTNGTITQTGAYPSFQVDSTGAFILCVTIANSAGCSSTYCDSLYVGPNGMLGGKVSATGFVINVVSPQAITGYEVAGINETSSATINTYPNPFSDMLSISAEGTSFRSFEIYSVDGKKVMQGPINGNIQIVSTSVLNKGIYMLNLIDMNGARFVKKVVKN